MILNCDFFSLKQLITNSASKRFLGLFAKFLLASDDFGRSLLKESYSTEQNTSYSIYYILLAFRSSELIIKTIIYSSVIKQKNLRVILFMPAVWFLDILVKRKHMHTNSHTPNVISLVERYKTTYAIINQTQIASLNKKN